MPPLNFSAALIADWLQDRQSIKWHVNGPSSLPHGCCTGLRIDLGVLDHQGRDVFLNIETDPIIAAGAFAESSVVMVGNSACPQDLRCNDSVIRHLCHQDLFQHILCAAELLQGADSFALGTCHANELPRPAAVPSPKAAKQLPNAAAHPASKPRWTTSQSASHDSLATTILINAITCSAGLATASRSIAQGKVQPSTAVEIIKDTTTFQFESVPHQMLPAAEEHPPSASVSQQGNADGPPSSLPLLSQLLPGSPSSLLSIPLGMHELKMPSQSNQLGSTSSRGRSFEAALKALQTEDSPCSPDVSCYDRCRSCLRGDDAVVHVTTSPVTRHKTSTIKAATADVRKGSNITSQDSTLCLSPVRQSIPRGTLQAAADSRKIHFWK